MKGIVAAGASVMPSSLVSEPAQGCSFCCTSGAVCLIAEDTILVMYCISN